MGTAVRGWRAEVAGSDRTAAAAAAAAAGRFAGVGYGYGRPRGARERERIDGDGAGNGDGGGRDGIVALADPGRGQVGAPSPNGDTGGAAAAGGAATTNAVVVRVEDGAAAAAAAGAGVGAGETAAGVPRGNGEEEGGEGEGDGEGLDFVAAPRAEGLTGDDFQCNICWELLARPVTLACGHTACESCMAKYLRAQAQAQAQIGNLRANRISCPAGCQRMIPLVLPEVTTMVQKLLTRGFPRAYRERLEETEPERALVSQVRRIADDAAAESRRRRRRHQHHHLGGGVGGAAMGGMAAGLQGGLPREVMGFGNVPAGFMQGFHGQQNAARFRLDVAVPQRDVPPAVSRWYKRMGLGLFVCLCVSWQHPGNGEGFWHPNLIFWRRDNDATLTIAPDSATNATGGQCTTSAGQEVSGDEGSILGSCNTAGGHENEAGSKDTGQWGKGNSSWLFSMELNAQEYVAHNRWTALRSLYPTNNPWSSPLFLYLNDPILLTSSSSSSGSPAASLPATKTSSTTASSSESGIFKGAGGVGRGTSGGGGGGSGSSGWFYMLASPVRYCLGTVENASSSVARILLGDSSGDDDRSDPDLGGGVTAAAAPAAAPAGGPGVGTEERARRKEGGGDGSDNDNGGHKDGFGAEAPEEQEEQEGRRGGDGSGGSRWREEEAQNQRGSERFPPAGGSFSAAKSSSAASISGDGDAPSSAAATDGGDKRRLFLEFYGPIVGVFSALGSPAWLAELLTVVATQLCPLLAAMPLLRLSTRGDRGGGGRGDGGGVDDLVSLDLSLDLAIYGVFTLLITTATFWRITWKTFKREQPRSKSLKLFLASSAIHLFREVVMIKVFFPLVEHVLFYYVLQWQSRYLVAWMAISLQIFIMRLLACLRVALFMARPFLTRGVLHTLETLWCHLFTYLLLGTRFFNTFFVGDGARRHGAQRAARRFMRRMRGGREGAQVADPRPLPQPQPQQQQAGVAGAGGGAGAGAGAGANAAEAAAPRGFNRRRVGAGADPRVPAGLAAAAARRNPRGRARDAAGGVPAGFAAAAAAMAVAPAAPNNNIDNDNADGDGDGNGNGNQPPAMVAQGGLGQAQQQQQQQHVLQQGVEGGGAAVAAAAIAEAAAVAAAVGAVPLRPVARRLAVPRGARGVAVPPGRREAHLLALAAAGNEDGRLGGGAGGGV
ncbi:unnamed protein product [Pylaiella littoralis]